MPKIKKHHETDEKSCIPEISFAVYLGDFGNADVKKTIETAIESINRAVYQYRKPPSKRRVVKLSEYQMNCIEAVLTALDEYNSEAADTGDDDEDAIANNDHDFATADRLP